MNIKKQGHILHIKIKNNTTLNEFISYLVNHSQKLLEYPYDIKINQKNVNKKKIFENALQCFYLVSKYKSINIDKLYPSQVQQSSNLQDTTNLSWNDIPYYQKYVNNSLNIISDTEYLLIYFSKLLESYDANVGSLLPSYPKTILNEIIHPNDIKEICYMTLLEWQIKGKRGNLIPMSKKESLNAFKTSFPSIYYLVFEKDGFEILKSVYEILKIIEKDETQSVETRKKCIEIYQNLLQNLSNKNLSEYFKKIDKIGLYSLGMANPRFNPSCLLTMYLLFYFYYLPTENIYVLNNTALQYIQKVKTQYFKKYPTNIFKYDYDKHNKIKKIELTSDYFFKEYVRNINKSFGTPQYNQRFDENIPMLFCNTNSSQLIT
jgi:hypothetical protein